MNAIRSEGLDNVLITVVRYFGGTKLGKRGLIDAYRAAAEDALAHGKFVEERVLTWLRIEYPHERTGQVEALLRAHQADRRDAEYGEYVSMRAGVPPSHREAFIEGTKGIEGMKVREDE
jgi:putative IMPACT (imprinted ancient) family translation regulator